MKRILAMLLAALMLLSCTAMAEVDPVSDSRPQINWVDEATDEKESTDNSKLDIKEDLTSRYQKEDGLEGAVKTELWLEVDNSGQIDVTVPLVLVFSTNVDGGTATVANNYKIYNNNERNSIAVDKIEVTDEGSTKMTFVGSATFNKLDENQRDYYSVFMKPEVADKTATQTSNNQETLNSLDMHSQVHTKVYDLYRAQEVTEYDKTKVTGESLMTLGQGGIINLKPTMKTTPLTFVTKENYGGNANAATQGVHLITVTYTVGLQYTNNVGSAITPNDDNANTWATEYLNPTNP